MCAINRNINSLPMCRAFNLGNSFLCTFYMKMYDNISRFIFWG